MISRICWECDQELVEYDEGHTVEDWKIYCEDCWQRMLKDKEG